MNSIKMRRNNKILLGLLALLLVMSTGYALFSKKITVGGNVTAKGSFKIDVSCEKGFSSEILNAISVDEGIPLSEITAEINGGQHGYTTDTCTTSGTSVTINTDFKYPGATRYYTVKMKNTGDIPASWNYKTGFVNNMSVYRYFNGQGRTLTLSDSEKGYVYNLEASLASPVIGFTGIKDASGKLSYSLDLSEAYLDFADADGNIIIEPNETMYFFVFNHWSRYAASEEHNYANGAYMTITLDYDFTFEQATE